MNVATMGLENVVTPNSTHFIIHGESIGATSVASRQICQSSSLSSISFCLEWNKPDASFLTCHRPFCSLEASGSTPHWR